MKVFSLVIFSSLLLSCSSGDDSKINVVKKDIEKDKSPLEMEGIKFISVGLSDREASKEILDIQQSRLKIYGSDMPIEYVEKALKDLDEAKGTKKYFRISATKANPDTTYNKVYYVNDKDSIIFQNLIK